MNGLSKSTRIAGRKLLVPVRQTVDFGHEGRAAHAPVKKGTFAKYYTVKKGDTLAAVAKRFNVSARLLSTWNNLKNKVALKPGRRIIIAKFTEKNGAMAPSAEKS